MPLTSEATDWDTIRERIASAARTTYDYETAYRAELERRDTLILFAFDHHVALPREIAAAAGISVTQVYRICAV